MDLVQNSLLGQNVIIGPPIYEFMERLLIGDAKAEFRQQANLSEHHTVANFTIVMNQISVHIFHTYTNRDQRQYIYKGI